MVEMDTKEQARAAVQQLNDMPLVEIGGKLSVTHSRAKSKKKRQMHCKRYTLGPGFFDAEPALHLPTLILGPEHRNIQHIVAECEHVVAIYLRGCPDPNAGEEERLHILVCSESQQAFNTATQLVTDLLEAASSKVHEWCLDHDRPEPTTATVTGKMMELPPELEV